MCIYIYIYVYIYIHIVVNICLAPHAGLTQWGGTWCLLGSGTMCTLYHVYYNMISFNIISYHSTAYIYMSRVEETVHNNLSPKTSILTFC